MTWIPSSQWNESYLRDSLAQELLTFGGVAQCEAPFSIEEAAGKRKRDRSVSGRASVEEISRSGLFINVEGLDVRRYNRDNPVVLAQHCPFAFGTLMPGAIGTVQRVHKGGKSLLFENMTFDTDPVAEAWYQKVVSRTVRMVSIGVVPIEVEYVEKVLGKGADARTVRYLHFVRSELIEISVVVVGANRGALIDLPPPVKDEAAEALRERVEDLAQQVAEFGETKKQLDALLAMADQRRGQSVNRLLQAAGPFVS